MPGCMPCNVSFIPAKHDAAMPDPVRVDPNALRPELSGEAPVSFAERGVAVAFTTPQLAGARLRAGARFVPEFVVGNPSGGRGVYIVPWDGVFSFCVPSLHDRCLYDRLRTLQPVTPRAVREASLDVALDGTAGRAVAAMAREARAAAARQVEATADCLASLFLPPHAGATGEPDPKRRAAAQLAPILGRSPEELLHELGRLAALLAPLGAGGAATQATIPATLAAIQAVRGGVAAALAGRAPGSRPDAELVVAAAETVLAAASALAAEALRLLRDPPALMRGWLDTPEALAAQLTRVDWLLDGWERICLVWQDNPHYGDALIAELADLVPAMPREAAGWAAVAVESPAGLMRPRRKGVGLVDATRGAAVQAAIARNERLRAMAPGVAA